jgi:chromosome segregation ATPase
MKKELEKRSQEIFQLQSNFHEIERRCQNLALEKKELLQNCTDLETANELRNERLRLLEDEKKKNIKDQNTAIDSYEQRILNLEAELKKMKEAYKQKDQECIVLKTDAADFEKSNHELRSKSKKSSQEVDELIRNFQLQIQELENRVSPLYDPL